MILVIGGQASGKREFVRSLGYTEAQISEHLDTPVVFHAENLVHTEADVPEVLAQLLKKEVVILNEVGSGVIPASKEKTQAREAAGRLGVLLARQADCVVRVICGIPTILKGKL